MKKIILFLCAMFIFFGCANTEVMQPVLKEKIEPVYPYEAKSRGIEGKVDLYLTVSEEGDVTKTTLLHSSGSNILDEASINYSKGLKFQPATLKGKPISVVVKWTLNYKLEDIYWENGQVKILCFTKTAGLKHESTEQGKKALKKLSDENNFDIEFSENSEIFTDEGLSNFNVIIFLNTSGDILNNNQEAAFKKFMQNHGGFVGIHNAIDTEPDWEWYTTLLGTKIKNRPDVREAVVRVMDVKHPSTKNLPYKWDRKDEFVDYSGSLANDIRVLAVVDGKGNGDSFHPFCWYHEFEGGRAWYTAGGHTSESFTDPVFIKHLIGGIKYAAGVE
jgi:TonB family protein